MTMDALAATDAELIDHVVHAVKSVCWPRPGVTNTAMTTVVAVLSGTPDQPTIETVSWHALPVGDDIIQAIITHRMPERLAYAYALHSCGTLRIYDAHRELAQWHPGETLRCGPDG